MAGRLRSRSQERKEALGRPRRSGAPRAVAAGTGRSSERGPSGRERGRDRDPLEAFVWREESCVGVSNSLTADHHKNNIAGFSPQLSSGGVPCCRWWVLLFCFVFFNIYIY